MPMLPEARLDIRELGLRQLLAGFVALCVIAGALVNKLIANEPIGAPASSRKRGEPASKVNAA